MFGFDLRGGALVMEGNRFTLLLSRLQTIHRQLECGGRSAATEVVKTDYEILCMDIGRVSDRNEAFVSTKAGRIYRVRFRAGDSANAQLRERALPPLGDLPFSSGGTSSAIEFLKIFTWDGKNGELCFLST